ncbi:hypothetical protein CJ030_MR2G016380 [Morella rubra]|uniref:Uncharacterized protein n=1 Tax=Morella rubra TaxID=262757 RepID=A0A6A1UG44_9ROSI|nr:hypothetical protein CJ030_MR0G025660 [Morella rubra]KAB1224491.1 hypothetical protein CJ030_MR2G016380 [Morella rubra]
MTAEDSNADGVVENGKAEDAKKVKPKKAKKPKASAINLFQTCSEYEGERREEGKAEEMAGIFYSKSSCYSEADKTFSIRSSVLLFDKVKTSYSQDCVSPPVYNTYLVEIIANQ